MRADLPIAHCGYTSQIRGLSLAEDSWNISNDNWLSVPGMKILPWFSD